MTHPAVDALGVEGVLAAQARQRFVATKLAEADGAGVVFLAGSCLREALELGEVRAEERDEFLWRVLRQTLVEYCEYCGE